MYDIIKILHSKAVQLHHDNDRITALACLKEIRTLCNVSDMVFTSQIKNVERRQTVSTCARTLSTIQPTEARMKSSSVISIDDSIVSAVEVLRDARNPPILIPLPPPTPSSSPALWSKMCCATFGNGLSANNENQFYFLNKKTGETRWEPPEDFVAQQQHNTSNATISTSTTNSNSASSSLFAQFELLDLYNFEKRNDAIHLTKKFQQLINLLQTAGSEEEWVKMILHTNYKLPRHVFTSLVRFGENDGDTTTTTANATLAAQILILFGKLDSSVWALILDYFEAQQLSVFYQILPAQFLKALHTSESADPNIDVEQQQLIWLMLMEEFFKFSKESPKTRGEHFDKSKIASALFECLEHASEQTFVQSGKTLVALNLHFEIANPGSNCIIQKCLGACFSLGHLCEVVLHLLNNEGFGDYYDPQVALNCLKVFEHIFAFPASAVCVFTNDSNVLVDVILREVANLPPLAELRTSYIRVLQLLLLNSEWAGKGRHRGGEIYKCLKLIFDEGINMYGVSSLKLVEEILEQLGKIEKK